MDLGGHTGSTPTPQVPGTSCTERTHTDTNTHKGIRKHHCHPGILSKNANVAYLTCLLSLHFLKAFRLQQNIGRQFCIRLKRCCYHIKPGVEVIFTLAGGKKRGEDEGEKENKEWRRRLSWNIKGTFLDIYMYAHVAMKLPFLFVCFSHTDTRFSLTCRCLWVRLIRV